MRKRRSKTNPTFFEDIKPTIRDDGRIKYYKANKNCPEWIKVIVEKIRIENRYNNIDN